MFYCSVCGASLRPGQGLCQCGQVFPHPVPEVIPEGEYRAHYWPPKQATAAQDTLRRAETWYEGISNKNKLMAFGGVIVMLIISVSAGAPHNRTENTQQSSNLPEQYRNPPPVTTQVPSAASVPADPPQAYIPPAPQPTVILHPSYDQRATGDNTSAIFVGNLDNFDWTNVRITINPGNGDYTLTTDVIHPNDSVIDPIIGHPSSRAFDSREFADSMGNRFSSSLKINRIQLTCDTPSGRATHTMTFTN